MYIVKTFFSFNELRTALLIALSFSAFIYLFHFSLDFFLLNTLLGLYAFYLLIESNRKTLFFAGFFIGLLWFYWIGFSFRYYDMAWAVPLVAFGFGLIYATIFWLVSLAPHPLLRAVLLFLLSLFEPFDFNWLQPELLFLHSYFGIEKWQFALVLLSLALSIHFKEKRGLLFLLLLLPALDFSAVKAQKHPLNIALVQTDINQAKKWNPYYSPSIIKDNLNGIDNAIREKKDLVVLPESAFPMFLNRDHVLMQKLKEKSRYITILTGSLYYENRHNFNASYFFKDGEVQIAKKMVLVPFGEYIPLPSFLARPINEAIFGGASDYLSASKPSDFDIKGFRFRNAICYEATCHELFEDNPSFMIATSNNAWFAPSIEPSLQKLLMQFYAKKHNTIIFHSANSAGGGVIYP
ncbi:apolipoprotein N-acyltransferase [Campylobacterota bacterium]